MKQFIAVKAVIRNEEGKVLMLRESITNPVGTNTGQLDFPGGRLEVGERWDDALRREVKEEAGLDVEIGEPFAVSEWRPIVNGEQWQVVGIFLFCSVIIQKNVRLSLDHTEALWIDPLECINYPLMENLRSVFDNINKLAWLALKKEE